MRRALPLLSLALLVGCDHGYGISRRARLSFLPEPSRVGTVVRETPGVDEVQYRTSDGLRPLTLTGIKPPDQVNTFWYRGGSNVHGTLEFVVDYKGTVEYSQSLMMLGRRPPQEWLDATRPVMLQIEMRLEQSCGLTNLQKSVEENFLGVKHK